MLPTSIETDPIVEILRLAYRRGLDLRQKHAREQNQTVSAQPLAGETLTEERKTSIEVESRPNRSSG